MAVRRMWPVSYPTLGGISRFRCWRPAPLLGGRRTLGPMTQKRVPRPYAEGPCPVAPVATRSALSASMR